MCIRDRYTTLGAGLWNSILAFIGYYLSTVPGIENEEQLLAKVTEYSHEIGYVFIGIGVLLSLIHICLSPYGWLRADRSWYQGHIRNILR